MEKHHLKNDWTLLTPHKKLLILEDEVKVRGLPHYVDAISININKTITISLSEFVDTFDTEEQAEI